ncbi:MAG: right-handed parallel beta-helix repeat-containing protein, partial [Candidatus Eisenbacteria bacterium]|nr:right-handed parallel beta-helix repeat-containing protein [Candidatus Eisenbacteria bacterium]
QRNRVLLSFLAMTCLGTTSWAATLTVDGGGGGDYTTIQAAINAAVAGDTVYVLDGTYSEALDIVDKPLTLQGETEVGVIIDASGSTDYSIYVDSNTMAADHYEFHDFTLIGNLSGTYGLKISGENITTTIDHVTVQDSKRTGVDLNGVAGGTISNVTVTGVPSGNGIALTDCDDITLSNLTTSGNAWGGLAIYTYGRYYTGGSNNVVLVSGGNSLADSPQIYTEVDNYFNPADPFDITNLSVSTVDYPYLVGGLPTGDHTSFAVDEVSALGAIVASTVPELAPKQARVPCPAVI